MDGPLQIEARIDQNAQLSGQLSLWNQQGSHVRRGTLIVMPVGRGLLYAEPIYLQAERSPMPELRHRRARAPGPAGVRTELRVGTCEPVRERRVDIGLTRGAERPAGNPGASRRRLLRQRQAAPASTVDALIRSAAQDLEDYQRLTAEGKLGEAGQRLESVKQKLQELQNRR